MGRPRRQSLSESTDSDRWLISYADLITLLFAFFVVMYSTASVNEGKMRVLSDSLVASFSGRNKTLAPIQVGKLHRSPHTDESSAITTAQELVLLRPNRPDVKQPEPAESPSGQDPAVAAKVPDQQMQSIVDDIADEVEDSLAELIQIQAVMVHRQSDWIEIEINTGFLFVSGSARLSDGSLATIKTLARVLGDYTNPVQVEGFTDDRPISTATYPSNWELSAARAASVVHLFMKMGIAPERLVAIGYGEHRPIASNDTETGRSRNRRVVIVIPADENVRRVLEAERRLGLSPRDQDYEL
ncbi:MAG: flagellar motor protein MotD [Gammaproteobacteria bacterium]|nr:flagellar motor protein MotD [Gammaproteobacteria bacterium]